MNNTQNSQQDEGEVNFTGQNNPNAAVAIEFMEKAKKDKKEMPRYRFRFIYYFFLPSLVFFLAGLFAAVMLYFSLQKEYQQKIIWFLPLIIWAALAVILIVVFDVWFGKIAKRIKEENLTELKNVYYDISLAQAEEKLREQKIITQEGFCYFLPQRLGGDEFLLIFRDIPKETLVKKLEDIKHAITNISVPNNPGLNTSVSMGAIYTANPPFNLFDLADKALYEAKKHKNCIVFKEIF